MNRRNDPDFWSRVRDVCGLCLNHPDNVIVLSVDPSLEIHVAMDNGSSHRSKYTRAWLAIHPRWVTRYTPPHASWVNQVELFFSILQRKVIKNGNFTSRDDLIAKLLAFVADYDQRARPFKWTYAADPLVA